MTDDITRAIEAIEDTVIGYRRDFHRYAEAGWTEFRTASLVARRLADLGWQVRIGREIIQDEERMGLPPPDELERHWQRALEQGGDPAFMDSLKGGFTGVVGILRHGRGPTVGLRFDMDAVEVGESQSPDHRPAREGFASVNDGVMHACGHDGHTAIGLGIAEVLATLRDRLCGTVKLVFQPAEEGVRGAKAMVSAGVVDDVDYMLGLHLYSGWPMGDLVAGRSGYLTTTKFDAFITGAPSHAGGRPHEGNNALLAAATAVLNLHAIPRHRAGATRINVGRLTAGTGRNVTCPHAHLVAETRGTTPELNEYMFGYAKTILEAAAAMHGCEVQIKAMGSAEGADSDPELAQRVERVAQALGGFSTRPERGGGGSEDYTYMMRRVQSRGGQATHIGLGADLGGWGHHSSEFDIDERGLLLATKLLSAVTFDLMENGQPS